MILAHNPPKCDSVNHSFILFYFIFFGFLFPNIANFREIHRINELRSSQSVFCVKRESRSLFRRSRSGVKKRGNVELIVTNKKEAGLTLPRRYSEFRDRGPQVFFIPLRNLLVVASLGRKLLG